MHGGKRRRAGWGTKYVHAACRLLVLVLDGAPGPINTHEHIGVVINAMLVKACNRACELGCARLKGVQDGNCGEQHAGRLAIYTD